MWKTLNPITDRVRHAKEICRHGPWRVWAGVVWAGYEVFVVWRDEFAEPHSIDRYRVLKLLPHLPFVWWLVISIAAMMVGLFESSYRIQKELETDIRTSEDVKAAPSKIEIHFEHRSPYEVSTVEHGHVLSTVRIGVKNCGGGVLSNCRIRVVGVSPESHLSGGLPILLADRGFSLRHDDPERLVDIAAHWDHVDQFRFMSPASGGFFDTLQYVDDKEPRTIVLRVEAQECVQSASFRIWTDEIKNLRLDFIGYVS